MRWVGEREGNLAELARTIQDAASELSRIRLPHTQVNKATGMSWVVDSLGLKPARWDTGRLHGGETNGVRRRWADREHRPTPKAIVRSWG
jgi:hypothetical protein